VTKEVHREEVAFAKPRGASCSYPEQTKDRKT
jgi:hypothetical protein